MRTGTCDRCSDEFVDTSQGQNRRFCTDNCRKREHDDTMRRGVCERCGCLLGANSLGVNLRCWDCREDRVNRHDRAKRIEQWWAEGLTVYVIAARLGWTKNQLASRLRSFAARATTFLIAAPRSRSSGSRMGGRVLDTGLRHDLSPADGGQPAAPGILGTQRCQGSRHAKRDRELLPRRVHWQQAPDQDVPGVSVGVQAGRLEGAGSVSYWFHISDAQGDELWDPYFDDTHPAIAADGTAGSTVMVTEQGYARCGNYTSNVSGMWAKCLTAVEVKPTRLRDLDGKRAFDLVTLLSAAVDWGIANLPELREQNPENGWGDAEGAITYLWDIQRACEQHPDGYLEISS